MGPGARGVGVCTGCMKAAGSDDAANNHYALSDSTSSRTFVPTPLLPSTARIPRGKRTCERLLNIHHLPRARLHEPTLAASRPRQSLPTRHHPRVLEIALVARDDAHGLHLARVVAVLALHVHHLQEIVQVREGGVIGDVVDEQEGVGAQVGCGPEPAIFFLAGRVGKGEEIGFSVDGARNRVGVLWERGSRAWLAKGWG